MENLPVTECEAPEFPAHLLFTKARDTGNTWYSILRQYPDNAELTMMKLESDENLRKGGGAKRKHSSKSEMDEVTLSKSKSRARIQVRRKCFSSDMDRMLTLTFKENVTEIAEAWAVFKYFSKLMRWRYKDRWFYVAVPEFQKRGAVHFHLAIKGFYHANTVRRLWAKASGKRGGNIDITSPKRINKNSWNPRRIAQYLSKYITKNETVGFNQRRYSSGGNIPEPAVHRGYVALGLFLPRFADQLFKESTRKKIAVIYEDAEGRPIFYCST